MPPAEAYTALTKLASKWGPWTALALVLVGFYVFGVDQKLDAQALQLAKLEASQSNQVKLLRIMCVAVVSTEAERTACKEVGQP